MRISHTLGYGLLALLLVGCGKPTDSDMPVKGNPAAETAAIESAQTWLALVDGEKFGPSWDEAATVFKSAINNPDWEKAARAVRAPLGKLVSRRIKSQHYATTLPGAPAGEYVVIQFDSAFANQANAIETITPMRDKDGKWRVSGYYIK